MKELIGKATLKSLKLPRKITVNKADLFEVQFFLYKCREKHGK